MNPRILKKLCKRVDPTVGRLFPHLKRIDYNDGDIPRIKVDRKHFEHWRGKPNDYGYFVPKKNTIGYGEMFGYEEPEWEDENAWSLFVSYIVDAFTDWDRCEVGEWPKCKVALKNPSDVFKYAAQVGLAV